MFYTRLQELCKEKNTNVSNMLKDLNLSTGSMGTWKRGKLPTGEILSKIAKYLDTSIDYLVEGVCADELSPDEKHLVETYRAAPEKAKYKILCDFEKMITDETEKLKILKLI
ncbi:MAG: helix-turn-helix domain-containing protein [Oscillospiraceae bacterium]|nr:helix-turn-helix domain-containing protein [Oscillospiraceae bacterium]